MVNAPVQMVPSNRVLEIAPYARPWLQAAVDRNGLGYNVEEVLSGCTHGAFQLWAAKAQGFEGFAVTELVTSPNESSVHIILAGGKGVSEVIPYIAVIEQWAKELGCQSIRVWGRPGWLRMLRKQGYHLETQVLKRSLNFEVQ